MTEQTDIEILDSMESDEPSYNHMKDVFIRFEAPLDIEAQLMKNHNYALNRIHIDYDGGTLEDIAPQLPLANTCSSS